MNLLKTISWVNKINKYTTISYSTVKDVFRVHRMEKLSLEYSIAQLKFKMEPSPTNVNFNFKFVVMS